MAANTGFQSIVSEFATRLTRMSLKALLTKDFSTLRMEKSSAFDLPPND